MLTTGLSWLADQMATHAASSVTYWRGAAFGTVSATAGRTMIEQTDSMGALIQHETRDFLIAADALDDLGVLPPAPGDLIEQTAGAVTRRYQVIAPVDGIPCWRWCDSSRAMVRVHVKDMGQEVGS